MPNLTKRAIRYRRTDHLKCSFALKIIINKYLSKKWKFYIMDVGMLVYLFKYNLLLPYKDLNVLLLKIELRP